MSETERTGCCGSGAERSTTANVAQTEAHRETVQQAYASVARAEEAGQSEGTASGCCGVSEDAAINQLVSTRLGYSAEELQEVPGSADMGLGCGNPKAIAALQPGEVVVDLGAGGGLDCFLASREVGQEGRVIGIDMTPEMLSKARRNAERGGFENAEFRLGEIEHLPVADGAADVILSNCVINLSADKPQVFREAYRILKPGGRLALSDVVATVELPDGMRNDPQLIAGCMGNAALVDDLHAMIRAAGFEHIRIAPKDESREFIRDWAPGRGVEDYVQSATLEAVKPGAASCCG
jgi:SAM-dependent methyltransferase